MNMMDCVFTHLATGATLKISAPSAESAQEQASKLVTDKAQWQLIKVKPQEQGVFKNFLG